ncbi:hypothetical protein V6C27_03910 [Peptococcaceae bacterium 1198_IL3148]
MPKFKKVNNKNGEFAMGYSMVREPTGSAEAINVDGTADPNEDYVSKEKLKFKK